jgi:cell division topological specificity factor
MGQRENTVEFFKKLLGFRASSTDDEHASKYVAKERLKLALTYDRGDLPRGVIEQLRDEIIQLMVKHLAINAEEIQINFDRTAEHDKLIASIPLGTTVRPQSQTARMVEAKVMAAKTELHKVPHRRRRR